MSPSPTTEAGPAQRYLYAITEAGALNDVSLDGIEDEPVRAVEADGLAVAASPLGRDDVRPRRRHLKAHHDTINALTEHGADLLPMSFGVVAESPTQLRRFLTRNQQRLRRQIDRLRNRVEIECRVAWQVDGWTTSSSTLWTATRLSARPATSTTRAAIANLPGQRKYILGSFSTST
jgi:hypothetical protein